MLAGRKVQLTLRDQDEQRLLARLERLLQRFPVAEVTEAPEETAQPTAQPQGEHWCRTHQAYMKKRPWGGYSHKTAEGWCHGNGK
jgi:hypothetical protein